MQNSQMFSSCLMYFTDVNVCTCKIATLDQNESHQIETFTIHFFLSVIVPLCSVFVPSYPSATTSLHRSLHGYLFIHDLFVFSFHSPPLLSAHLFIPLLPLALPHPHSLHSMRVKATKLCIPLPPLLRLSSPHCPSQPAPRWTTGRWRRSRRSASGCRWRCTGYGKKTNRWGWVAQKPRGNMFAFPFSLVHRVFIHESSDIWWRSYN